jgi:sugar lactone lactonase YvrE
MKEKLSGNGCDKTTPFVLAAKSLTMKTSRLIVYVFLLVASVACKSTPAKVDNSAKMFSLLPDYCNTPDGMTYCQYDNTILLAVPNFNNTTYPGIIMKVDLNGQAVPFFPAPVHPETGKGSPMGLEFGPDGNLYYADNQYFFNKNYKSRVMRVVIENGKPVRCETVMENLKLANAVRWNGDYLYVSDTFFDLADSTGDWGGIYRASLAEMNKGCIKLRADKNVDDPHLVTKAKCIPNHRKDIAGFDGMCFDKDGNLYSGNFGDGQFYRITFNGMNGTIKEFKVIDHSLTCVDGICYDSKRNVIYIADSEKNAIHQWDIAKNKMSTLSENKDTDGADGLMDQPCEPIALDNKIVIANFDMPFPGLKNSKYDKVHTLSVIHINK